MQQADSNAIPSYETPPIHDPDSATNGGWCTRADVELFGMNARYVIPAGTLVTDLANDASIFTGEALAVLAVAAEKQSPNLIEAAARLASMAKAAMDAANAVTEPALSEMAAPRRPNQRGLSSAD